MVEQVLTATDSDGDCRALVALAPAAARRHPTPRPAAFLAHLIAVKQQHPQTRERRRAAPAEATSAYRKAMALDRTSSL